MGEAFVIKSVTDTLSQRFTNRLPESISNDFILDYKARHHFDVLWLSLYVTEQNFREMVV